MKKYLALFKCAENSIQHIAWKKLSKDVQIERLNKGEKAIQQWKDSHSTKILDIGFQLGKIAKFVNPDGVQNIPSQIGMFHVILANSHDEAADIFLNHPHFKYFPGDGIEIVECLDSPRT